MNLDGWDRELQTEYLSLKRMFVSDRSDDGLQYNVPLEGVKAT